MAADVKLEALLREDADRFVATLVVVAEARGVNPADMVGAVIMDSLSRLQEAGWVSAHPDDEAEV